MVILRVFVTGLAVQIAASALAQPVWHKHPGNPVLDLGPPGAWDDARVGPAAIIRENGVYRLYYGGWDGTPNRHWQGGCATSMDGINWTRDSANPVLVTGPAGAWDEYAAGPDAVINDGERYKMWYSGWGGTSISCIGYAESTDGINWTKHPGNPVLQQGPAGAWDSGSVHWGSVIKDGDQYQMWYSGCTSFYTHRIGYATSPDGITWTKYPGNPVLVPCHDGSWDDDQVWFPRVVKQGAVLHMWYAGDHNASSRIGYATSDDGINWQVQECNPVLGVGAVGSWDEQQVCTGAVLPGSPMRIWYQGFDAAGIGRVGYAKTATCGADLDGDGDVDVADFAMFQQEFSGPLGP